MEKDNNYLKFIEELKYKSDLDGYIPLPQPDFSKMSKEERSNIQVTQLAPFNVHVNIIKHVRKDACANCWLLKRCCMCCDVRPVVLPKTPLNLKFHFFMHYKEFLRASNTVKVLNRCLGPEYAEILLFGIQAHEDRFFELLEKHHTHCVLLFPSNEAVPVEEYLQLHPELLSGDITLKNSSSDSEDKMTKIIPTNESNTSDPSTLPDTPEFHVFVLDGTWGQANHMRKHINQQLEKRNISPPTHVKIDPHVIMEQGSLFAPLRSQTQEDRCSTLEASVAFLKTVGFDNETCEKLLENEKILVDYLDIQCNGEGIYGYLNKEDVERLRKPVELQDEVTKTKKRRLEEKKRRKEEYEKNKKLKHIDEDDQPDEQRDCDSDNELNNHIDKKIKLN